MLVALACLLFPLASTTVIAQEAGGAPPPAAEGAGPIAELVGLMRKSLEVPPSMKLDYWGKLCSFRPSVELQESVKARGDEWAVHRIEDAGGPLSLDYYSVHVTKAPLDPATGRAMTPEQLFAKFREQLLTPSPGRADILQFSGIGAEPATLSAGSILRIKFFPKPAMSPGVAALVRKLKAMGVCNEPSWDWMVKACEQSATVARDTVEAAYRMEADEGNVVVSQASSKEWRLSTIRAGAARFAGTDEANVGAHPVSGNRAFGYDKLNQGGHVFYVMGADRVTRTLKLKTLDPVAAIGFTIADLYWRLFVVDFAQFVNAKGGAAEVKLTVSGRIPWNDEQVPEIYKPANEPAWK